MGTGTQEATDVIVALDAACAELERVANRSGAVPARARAEIEAVTGRARELRAAVEAVQAAVHGARVNREAVQRRDAALEALHVAQLLLDKRKHPRGPIPPEVLQARERLEEAERALQEGPGLGDAERARIAAAANAAAAAVELLRSGAVAPLAEVRGLLNDCEGALARF